MGPLWTHQCRRVKTDAFDQRSIVAARCAEDASLERGDERRRQRRGVQREDPANVSGLKAAGKVERLKRRRPFATDARAHDP